MAKIYNAPRGFLSAASNTIDVDYLKLAYAQAVFIKIFQQKVVNYAIIVDRETAKNITPHMRFVFDRIIEVDRWNFEDEWQVRNLSPWQETIKLDADMIITQDISHWWDILRNINDVVLPVKTYDIEDKLITNTIHRPYYKEMYLPLTYTALYYFRDSVYSANFFDAVKQISESLPTWFTDKFPSPGDDEYFSLIASLPEWRDTHRPIGDIPSFTHVRPELCGLSSDETLPNQRTIHMDWNNGLLWIGPNPQFRPVHDTTKSIVDSIDINVIDEELTKRFNNE